MIQDYDYHKDIYKPEVLDSKLVSQHDDDFQIYLLRLKKKISAVVLDAEHEVHYRLVDPTRLVCRSYTTRTAGVENVGTPEERVLQPDTGYVSYGACVPIGDSSSLMAVWWSSVEPYR